MKWQSPPVVTTGQHYRQRLMADPCQLAAVRRTVREHLRLWGREPLADAVAMCVTEILANVHRHVDDPECELVLENLPEGVRAEVSDRAAALPVVVEEPGPYAERGRGMFLLSRTADRWGASPTPTGKRVWVLLHDTGAAAGTGATVSK